jgi:hypothetical protein
VVEWDGLENRCGLRSTEGSNPSLPAKRKRVYKGAFLCSAWTPLGEGYSNLSLPVESFTDSFEHNS